MPENDTQTIGAVERATTVLMLFAGTRARSLGVTEIANTLSLSKAVVHRVLASLKAANLIAFDDTTRRYSLGPASLALGQAYLANLDLREVARPCLMRLSEATGETVTLSVRHGDERVYVDQITPPVEVAMTVNLGKAFPLYAGSSSKAFLAFLPEADQERYLSNGSLSALTQQTIVDPEALRDELATIRKRGFARSFGERQAGAGSVAAPVFNHTGEPVAVMSVAGPVERFRQEADEAAKQLLVETRELSRRLGFQ
jgi:DNA-binding IclR family transcriptional regulator